MAPRKPTTRKTPAKTATKTTKLPPNERPSAVRRADQVAGPLPDVAERAGGGVMAHAHADCYAQDPAIDVEDGYVSISIGNFRLVMTALEAYRFYEQLDEALDTLKAQGSAA